MCMCVCMCQEDYWQTINAENLNWHRNVMVLSDDIIDVDNKSHVEILIVFWEHYVTIEVFHLGIVSMTVCPIHMWVDYYGKYFSII